MGQPKAGRMEKETKPISPSGEQLGGQSETQNSQEKNEVKQPNGAKAWASQLAQLGNGFQLLIK